MVYCKGKPKCYQSKNKKNCTAPNPWIIYLRTNKSQFKSIGEYSKHYRTIFRPQLKMKMLTIAGEYSTQKEKKKAMHNLLCRQFYKHMKKEKKTAAAKKKLSGDVTKLLKKHSIPKTLSLIAGKKIADAAAAKIKAKKKAADDVEAKKRVAETKKKMAAFITKKALLAKARAVRLEKEAKRAKKAVKSAKTKASRAKPTPSRSRKTPRRSSGRGTKSRASQSGPQTAAVKKAKATAEKKAKTAASAKRKVKTLEKSADKAAKKVKTAEKAVASAKKTQTKVAKKKIPRALAGLDSNLIVRSNRRRRRA